MHGALYRFILNLFNLFVIFHHAFNILELIMDTNYDVTYFNQLYFVNKYYMECFSRKPQTHIYVSTNCERSQ